jgi:anti-anti-sigma factor
LAFRASDRATVYVSGEVDIATAPQLTAAMTEALLDDRDLVVDLSRVTFFGASGINALAQALTDAQRAGRVLRVTGAPETTRELLRVSGFEQLLAVSGG